MHSKKNIIVFSDLFPPISNAGAESIAYRFSLEYLKRGFKVSIITINPSLEKYSIQEIYQNGLKIIQIGFDYNKRLIPYLSLYNKKIINIIKQKIKDNDIYFAHLHNIHRYISYGIISELKKLNIKTILTTHDAMSIEYGKFTQGINPSDLSLNPEVNLKINPIKSFLKHKRYYNPFRNRIIRHYMQKLDKIVTVSYALEELLNTNGIKNTVTIHNGLSEIKTIDKKIIEKFKLKYKDKIKKNDKLLLWAGRLSTAKGEKQVLKLMNKIVTKRKDIKLFIAGGKMEIPSKLKDNIILSGWLTKDEMNLAYKIVEITLVPSIYPDPFPTVVLESMRVGTPVIATCFGGAKEAVLDRKTGYITNPFNIEDFYTKVIHILDNDILKQEMSLNSKNRFKESFIIDKTIDKYFKLVENL